MATLAPTNYNYAQNYGIHNVGAAIFFAIIYVPCFVYYIFQAARRRQFLFFFLVLFCQVRIVSFGIRAALAKSATAGEDLNLFVVYEVLYTAGFFGVFYGTFDMIYDRGILADTDRQIFSRFPAPLRAVARIVRNRHVIHVVILTALVLSIVGAIDIAKAQSASSVSTGQTLRDAGTYVFLGLAVFMHWEAYVLAYCEFKVPTTFKEHDGPAVRFCYKAGTFVMFVITSALLIREAFMAGTVNNAHMQTEEGLWYPLVALTEYIAISLFAVPGLVPTREELRAKKESARQRQFEMS